MKKTIEQKTTFSKRTLLIISLIGVILVGLGAWMEGYDRGQKETAQACIDYIKNATQTRIAQQQPMVVETGDHTNYYYVPHKQTSVAG